MRRSLTTYSPSYYKLSVSQHDFSMCCHVLTMLVYLETEENIEMEELIDDFVTFYVAGQETTGNLLSFCIVLLQQHPDVLHR